MEKYDRCRVCAHQVYPILDFGTQFTCVLWKTPEPPASSIYHPLTLNRCSHCGLVQISNFVPPENIYVQYDIQRRTAVKNLPQTDWQIELLRKHVSFSSNILEVGSNDGSFLHSLRCAGFTRTVGVDPAKALNTIARKSGFDIWDGFATPAMASNLASNYGEFDLLVAKHMFGHIVNLDKFFSFAEMTLKPNGKLFLEIPDAAMIFDTGDCGMIYEEIVSYFTLETLTYALNLHGFDVISTKRFMYNGGLLEVLAERQSGAKKTPTPPPIHPGLDSFPERAKAYVDKLTSALSKAHAAGYRVCMVGGGMRSAALLNYFSLAKYIDALIDDNPSKQGLFYPGCGLPITSFSGTPQLTEKGRKVFLLAVSNENEAAVTKKIEMLCRDDATCVSVFGPNDRDRKLEKLFAILV